jgi:hypothetical protein
MGLVAANSNASQRKAPERRMIVQAGQDGTLTFRAHKFCHCGIQSKFYLENFAASSRGIEQARNQPADLFDIVFRERVRLPCEKRRKNFTAAGGGDGVRWPSWAIEPYQVTSSQRL